MDLTELVVTKKEKKETGNNCSWLHNIVNISPVSKGPMRHLMRAPTPPRPGSPGKRVLSAVASCPYGRCSEHQLGSITCGKWGL